MEEWIKMVTKVILVALHSPGIPAISDSLAISVLAGCLNHAFKHEVEIKMLNLYAVQRDREKILLETVNSFQPDVLVVSVVYGSFEWLRAIYPQLFKVWQVIHKLTIFGGAVPTYVPEQMIELDPNAIVITGEGDEALVEIINHFRKKLPYKGIHNTYVKCSDYVYIGQRRLVNLDQVPPPDRSLASAIVAMGGQIFSETSRGCTWGKCHFCGRGVTDITGGIGGYRRFPVARVVDDLRQLHNCGIQAVCFADEEFLGHSSNDVLDWLCNLRDALNVEAIKLRFDINVMVNSVILSKWTNQHERQKRKEIWDILQDMGLQKVFLGIESGSNSQLKRYRKGITAEQSIEALSIISERGIRLEAGFIMFDPLCTTSEILENIHFIRDNGIVEYISSLDNELRGQKGNSYSQILLQEQQIKGVRLLGDSYDPSTLLYPTYYLDPQVKIIVEEVRLWRKQWNKFHYSLKSLSRASGQPYLQSTISNIRAFLADLRIMYLQHFEHLVKNVSGDNYDIKEIRYCFYNNLKVFVNEGLTLVPEVQKAGISKIYIQEFEEEARICLKRLKDVN